MIVHTALADGHSVLSRRIKTVDDTAIREAMSKDGASFRKVAKELGVSLSTVQRAMKENAKSA